VPDQLNYDPTTAEGEAIGRLFRGCKNIERNNGGWNGGDIVQWLCEWFTSLGINPDGSVHQVDAIPPQKISPEADPDTVAEFLAAHDAFTTSGFPTGHEGFFYAEEASDTDDDSTVLTFPTASPARLRTAIALLRRAGYTATEQALSIPGRWARTVRVHTDVVHALPDDASVADRATRLLWSAGFTWAGGHGRPDVVAYTTPTPVSWRPGWVQIDVTGPRTSGREAREEVAHAVTATLTLAGWDVDVRGTESLHVIPLAAAETDQDATASALGEPAWQHGDVVLDAAGEVWTRASARDEAQGWPWAHGAATTLCHGRPYSSEGSSSEEQPVRPLTLLVRSGSAVQPRRLDTEGKPDALAEQAGPLPADVRASIAALVEEHWEDEKRDYTAQDPADRVGHAFTHLKRINAYLRWGRH
jgi:rhodanese-related sulfurtransferase